MKRRMNQQIISMLLMITVVVMGLTITNEKLNVKVEAAVLTTYIDFKSPIDQFNDRLELAIHEKNEAIRLEQETIAAAEEAARLEAEAIAAAAQVVNLQSVSRGYNVFTPTNLSTDDLYNALGGSRSGLYDIVPAIADAEDIYGVNAIYLLATIGYESGWGKYETGWNNIAGWRPGGVWQNFNSRYECIMTIADGLYHSFLPDVGDTLGGVTWRYCKDPNYTDNIMKIMNELQNNIY